MGLFGESDRAKFERLYEEYKGLAFRAAGRILRERMDVEDAVQQAFEAVFKNIKKISDADRLKTRAFIVLITERKALDMIRAKRKYAPEDPDAEVPAPEIAFPGESGLAAALARLNPRYRQAILLRFYFGYTNGEIARFMGITAGAAQRLISRAREALRIELEKEGIDV